MFFSLIFDMGEDVIKIYYHKDVKLLCQNLVDIALECDQCVGQSKRHDLVLKVAIAGPKSSLLFIFFFDSHPIVNID